MSSGAATTTVYPSSMADDVAFILGDSDSHVVFAEDARQVAKLRDQRAELPALTKVVVFDPDGASAGEPEGAPVADDGWVITLDDLEALGADLLADEPDVVERRVAETPQRPPRHPDLHLGNHRAAQGRAAAALGVDLRGRQRPGARHPDASTTSSSCGCRLSHSFGKVLLSAQLAVGFPTAVDGRVDKIVDNLAVIRPTFMGAAPRIFEKAHARVVTMTDAEGGIKKKIFDRAFEVGLEVDTAAARRASRCRGCSPYSTRSSTGSCSPRSGRGSAAGCGSSSPERPRSTRTSPSGSTPRAS